MVCLKTSERIEGWLREAYFGLLLGDEDRVVRVYEAFAACRPGGRPLYCLGLEYAHKGDLSDYLRSLDGEGLPESDARREIRAITQVLARIHKGQGLHRDLTPFNILVTKKGELKIGDFGIAKHQRDERGVPATLFNPFGAPTSIQFGLQQRWQRRDDLYQVGQLLAMLVRGDADVPVSTREIRDLPCSDHLKEIIHRCIGPRHKRYQTAEALLDALRRRPVALSAGRVDSLRGVHLAFTGRLRLPRRDAVRAAKRAGAIVHPKPSRHTTIVVRGQPSPVQAAGPDAGLKLMEVRRLEEQGYPIQTMTEARFWKLARLESRRPTSAR